LLHSVLFLGMVSGTKSGNAEYSGAQWTIAAISIFRSCCLAVLLFLTTTVENHRRTPSSVGDKPILETTDTQNENSQVPESESEEEEKIFSLSAIWTKLYNFRTYFIPTDFLARVSLVAFIGSFFLDAAVDLYSSITFPRICKCPEFGSICL